MPADAGQLSILAFEPFDAGSHRAVREAISRHSRHRWRWLTRPGRAWKWRMRLAAPEMIDDARRADWLDQAWDVIFVTSLMSAADLRAILPPNLRNVPIMLYMHENQAAYPDGHAPAQAGDRDVHFPLTNLTSILAADLVLWNSEWNLRSFLAGIASILKKAPDVRLDHVRDQIEATSRIIWPPVEPPPDEVPAIREQRQTSCDDAVRVVWPHRWEHDKGPDELLATAREHSDRLNLRWTLLGEQYRTIPPALETFQQDFADRIDHAGYVPDRHAYWRHLARCDWVLSTARHEFFGIAVVESMLAGCLPWLPDRLSYRELVPNIAQGLSPLRPPDDPEMVRQAIRDYLDVAIAPNAVSRLDALLSEVAVERLSSGR